MINFCVKLAETLHIEYRQAHVFVAEMLRHQMWRLLQAVEQ